MVIYPPIRWKGNANLKAVVDDLIVIMASEWELSNLIAREDNWAVMVNLGKAYGSE